MSAPALIRRDDSAGVATISLTSSATRNALSLQMIDTLLVAFDELARDASAKAVVIAAEGPVFSSGHDLRELRAHRNDADRGAEFYEKLFRRCAAFMRGLTELRQPVIAAVEGIATAAGCQLVAACDLAVAGEAARFSLPGAKNAFFCSTPLVAVGRAVSRKHAMEIALTGAFVDARRAEAMGLVNRVAPRGRRSRRRRRWRLRSPAGPRTPSAWASARSTSRSSCRSRRLTSAPRGR